MPKWPPTPPQANTAKTSTLQNDTPVLLARKNTTQPCKSLKNLRKEVSRLPRGRKHNQNADLPHTKKHVRTMRLEWRQKAHAMQGAGMGRGGRTHLVEVDLAPKTPWTCGDGRPPLGVKGGEKFSPLTNTAHACGGVWQHGTATNAARTRSRPNPSRTPQTLTLPERSRSPLAVSALVLAPTPRTARTRPDARWDVVCAISPRLLSGN